MPFERYLRTDDHPNQTYYYQDPRHVYESDDADCHYTSGQHLYLPENTHPDHHHPHAVQFQIPQFMLNGPPVLAPGGGAEVLPAGLLDSGPDSFTSSWFSNNGFAPFHSALISRHIASSSTPSNSASTTAAYHTFPLNGSQCLPPPAFTGCVDLRQQSLSESPPSLDAATTYIPKLPPSPPSAGSFNATSYSLSNALVPNPPSLPVSPPSALGLSVYSASGFDVLSILSRVVNRPNPTVQLGPVDLSCSFVIVDVRRYDSPIVYASPMFCHLTGYGEQEVLGRNCRFLQSPTGNVVKGEPRRFASPKAVSYMRKLLSSSKECQTTLINYRKGGQAFFNLVTVIPLRGGVHNTPEEADEVAYHIGFQVALKQPNRILDKLWDGSYHYSSWGTSGVSSNAGLPGMSHGLGQLAQAQNMTNIGIKGGRHGQMMSIAVSKELRNLIADTTFTDSVPISTGTNMSGPTNTSSESGEQPNNTTMPLTMFVTPPPSSTSTNRAATGGNTMATSSVSLSPSLSRLLLEFLPDFLLVLSLKGAFLYVAPSVRLVLGYEPEELVGRSISDICHPADLVPLMRELKEGSVSGLSLAGTTDLGSSAASNLVPKTVDLLFRALPKVSTSSSCSQTQEVSSVHGVFQSSKSSSASLTGSQSPLSSGTLCSNDPSDGTIPPYVWLECRGRLHVEPGKGRKAIILSGRARWMPVVRWGTIDKAGGLRSGQRHREATHGGSCTTTGSRLSETSPGEAAGAASIDPQEFWALLSSQGTFLVASASARDVLGWGTSEMIGRSIWAMVRDSRSGLRERVEAELSKLDPPEARSMVDPPPTVVTTSLVHRESHVVPVRLVFYRTPRSRKHAPPSLSTTSIASTPLIHPLNNPLCPIVCQATVLSNTEYQSSNHVNSCFDGHGSSPVRVQINTGSDSDDPSIHRSGASLFEELEIARGSSWQYELQQLKFANQRLQEELNVLEASSGASAGSSSSTIGRGPIPFGHPSSPTVPLSIPQQQMSQAQLHYTPLMHSTLSTTLTSMCPPNSLHEQDPPSSEWSSLTGANGQGANPLKRSWRSGDGPMT